MDQYQVRYGWRFLTMDDDTWSERMVGRKLSDNGVEEYNWRHHLIRKWMTHQNRDGRCRHATKQIPGIKTVSFQCQIGVHPSSRNPVAAFYARLLMMQILLNRDLQKPWVKICSRKLPLWGLLRHVLGRWEHSQRRTLWDRVLIEFLNWQNKAKRITQIYASA